MLIDVGLRSSIAGRLAAAGCVAAPEEATVIVGTAPDRATADAWVSRRESGEPLAWIVGHVRFCGTRVEVAPGVYVPRVQSEDLARRAAAALPERGCAVDLCTGAGAVAAHLVRRVPTAFVLGVDIAARAVACARRNGVVVVVGDVADPIRSDHRFDVVTAVAPYVPTGAIALLPSDVRRFEPAEALDGGPDGLDVVRRVIAAAARLLRRDGRLLIEVGGCQDEVLLPVLVEHGFADLTPFHDGDGDLRGIDSRAGGVVR